MSRSLRYSAAFGAGNGSNVQFYTVSSSNANFGINYPSNYCQSSPEVATNIFYNGLSSSNISNAGIEFDYSNVGIALLGYLVEVIAKQPFDEFCDENIFKPLGMENTSWNLSDLDVDNVALPYYDSENTKGHYECPDYPNGMLRSTLDDMAKFLIMFIQNGEYNGTRILEEETAKLMKEVHFESKEGGEKSRTGLTWYYLDYPQGESYLGHDGAEEGVTTKMFYNVESEVYV